ncbi:MAG TPA: acyltransferase [Acidobacteriaceae bacterium]|nr:acyltransferase [Acidobacteriaceae bacterium]
MPDARELTAEKRSPLPALTGIRIFAAYYVVMLHTGAGYFGRHGAPEVVLRLLNKGYSAVSLFFILSGFILVYTYQGKMSGPENVARFWEARFARIYPVYLLALALMAPFAKTITVGQRLAVLTMVQTWMPWKPEMIGAWNFPAWSLSVEAFFYLSFPLILIGLKRLRVSGLRWVAGILLALIVVGRLPRPVLDWQHSAIAFVRYIPVPVLRLPEFIVGMALGLVFLRTPGRRFSALISIGALLTAIVVLCLPSAVWASVAVIPFAILVISLAYQSGPVARFLSNRIIILLGSASYAVYLLQLPTRIYTRLVVAQMLHAPHGLDAFLSPCFLLILSILVFLFWEEPARKFLRKSLGLRPRWKWAYLPAEHPLPDEAVIKSAEER